MCALVALLACSQKDESEAGAKPQHEADPFEHDGVIELKLTLDPAAMADLARDPRSYVEGELAIGKRKLEEIGVRFKGHRSLRKWSQKPSFKLKLDYRHDDQTWAGFRTVVLNAMVEDPTMVRETLGYAVFRALGVPAPRTSYAEVVINGERFGLYSLIEPTEGPFLRKHFKSEEGVTYEGEYGCDLYPDDVLALELDTGKDKGRKYIRALSRAAEGPIEGLLDEQDGLLDAERFFGFLAAGALVADFDGYRHAHNYRMHFDPEAARWSLMPWGLDRVFTKALDVFESQALLARKCFDDAACRLRYVRALRDGAQRVEAMKLPALLDRTLARMDAAAKRDNKKPYDDDKRAAKIAELRAKLGEQLARVRAQGACWDGARELDADGDGHGCMDCDDKDASVHPGAAERCDQRDDDCDGVADDSGACPCAVEMVEGVQFSLCDRAVSWQRAGELCREQGAVLAYLESDDQTEALGRAVAKLRATDWWIGLNDRKREGRRAWHGEVKNGYREWASGEPDDYACGEDCVAIKDDSRGRWRDLHCATPQPFVCRKP